jgi:hypothetical protein
MSEPAGETSSERSERRESGSKATEHSVLDQCYLTKSDWLKICWSVGEKDQELADKLSYWLDMHREVINYES